MFSNKEEFTNVRDSFGKEKVCHNISKDSKGYNKEINYRLDKFREIEEIWIIIIYIIRINIVNNIFYNAPLDHRYLIQSQEHDDQTTNCISKWFINTCNTIDTYIIQYAFYMYLQVNGTVANFSEYFSFLEYSNKHCHICIIINTHIYNIRKLILCLFTDTIGISGVIWNMTSNISKCI